MIRVERPSTEPNELTLARSKRLPEMRAKWSRGEQLMATDFKDYGVAKPALAASSNNKCWYCERMVEAKYEPVEHWRPKTKAQRGQPHPTHGYWWLAWSWENLLFTCIDCNSAKGIHFPLAPASIALQVEEMPPGKEQPLLLNPTVDDPLDHIEFRREKDDRWKPFGKTEMGWKTIRVLQLDGLPPDGQKGRPGILDLYRDHVNERVQPRVDHFKDALRTGNMEKAEATWWIMCRSLLQKSSPYAALAYHAIPVLLADEPPHPFELPRPPYSP